MKSKHIILISDDSDLSTVIQDLERNGIHVINSFKNLGIIYCDDITPDEKELILKMDGVKSVTEFDFLKWSKIEIARKNQDKK